MIPRTLRHDSAEWQLLLACAAPLHDAALIRECLRAPVDWSELRSLAERHRLVPLLARTLGEATVPCIPAEFRQELREQCRTHLLRTLALTAELFRLADGFAAAKIDAVAVKGPTLAVQAYGEPGLRQYFDIDILVRHRDALRATEVMCKAGFATELSLEAVAAGRVPGQFLFAREGTSAIVELHTEKTLRYFPRRLPLDSLLARRVPVPFDGRQLNAFSPEDTLSIICVHGAKHLWERLLWIADVAALVTRPAKFDWSRALATAQETGAERMVHLGLCLAQIMLQVQVPEEISQRVRADRVASRLAADVLQKLPAGKNYTRSVMERALFRARMRGGLLRGTAYLLRLTLAPTEEDWKALGGDRRSRWIEALQRPLRLAQKYGRKEQGTI